MAGAGGSGADAFRRFRTGFGVAWGAPFTTHVIGLALVAGLDVTNRYDTRYTPESLDYRAITRVDAYVQQTFFVQAPLGRVRPYLALGVALVSAQPNFMMGSADVGLQFPIF